MLREIRVRNFAVIDAVTAAFGPGLNAAVTDRKSTRLNSSHVRISYAVFCLKKKKKSSLATREILSQVMARYLCSHANSVEKTNACDVLHHNCSTGWCEKNC